MADANRPKLPPTTPEELMDVLRYNCRAGKHVLPPGVNAELIEKCAMFLGFPDGYRFEVRGSRCVVCDSLIYTKICVREPGYRDYGRWYDGDTVLEVKFDE